MTVKRLVLRDAKGEAQSLVQVLEDQTERLETQAELDRARNFLDAVIENIPTSILVKDARDDRHVVINRAAGTVAAVAYPEPPADDRGAGRTGRRLRGGDP